MDASRIALIPDEYTHDPNTAFELGLRWGVRSYELRYAYRWRLPAGPAWVSDLVEAAVKRYGVTVTAISPGLFKPAMREDGTTVPISVETPQEVRRHLDERLPAQFAFAERVGTRSITVFAMPKPAEADDGHVPAIVVDSLAEAAAKAQAAGFQLLLENGNGTWADSGRAAKALLDAIGSDALRLTWDPGNVIYGDLCEDPVTEGFALARPYVANVHVKDATVEDGTGRWQMIGEGRIDWRRHLRDLKQAGYEGHLTLEPHLRYQNDRDLVAMMETFLGRVKELLA